MCVQAISQRLKIRRRDITLTTLEERLGVQIIGVNQR